MKVRQSPLGLKFGERALCFVRSSSHISETGPLQSSPMFKPRGSECELEKCPPSPRVPNMGRGKWVSSPLETPERLQKPPQAANLGGGAKKNISFPKGPP